MCFGHIITPWPYSIDKWDEYRGIQFPVISPVVLVGCLRILSDGYYFGTITELLVLPEYRRQGIGSKLLHPAQRLLGHI
ncbi:GNAT family N-acetyltransferase [Intestinimonas butyriciproducens]|uniref:GNAT family N-acetyltransferase n=1 Tax=Intestinimonas butyriciproducens TaxID=1297617 RepID=UPI002FE57FD7